MTPAHLDGALWAVDDRSEQTANGGRKGDGDMRIETVYTVYFKEDADADYTEYVEYRMTREQAENAVARYKAHDAETGDFPNGVFFIEEEEKDLDERYPEAL